MNYVDGYIHLEGLFILAGGRDLPTEILHVFNHHNKYTIASIPVASFPYPPYKGTELQDTYTPFGAILNDKPVIGIHSRQ